MTHIVHTQRYITQKYIQIKFTGCVYNRFCVVYPIFKEMLGQVICDCIKSNKETNKHQGQLVIQMEMPFLENKSTCTVQLTSYGSLVYIFKCDHKTAKSFCELRHASPSVRVCPSACNSSPIEGISLKFIFRISVQTSQVSLKSEKNNEYFT